MFKSNEIKDGAPRILTIRIPPDGAQSVEVRFPTDAEWNKRTASLKMEQRELGRGKTRTEAKNGVKVNADLYRRIAVNGDGDKVDEFTASWVIDQLERCDVVEITRDQGVFVVKLSVKGGIVTHFLDSAKLTQDKVVEYRRQRSDVVRNGNVIEVRTRLEPAGILYDKLQIDGQPPENYADAVPVIHKAVVVDAVLDEIDRLLADYNDQDEDDDDDDRDDDDREDDDEPEIRSAKGNHRGLVAVGEGRA